MSFPLASFLGVAGLTDVGYAFYDASETIIGSRVTSGVVDAGDGWYSAQATIPTGANSVRWNSAGTATAIAREYFDPRLPVLATGAAGAVSTYAGADTSGTATLLTRITGAVPLAADYSTSRAAKLDNLDATVSSRMATFTYTAPDNSDIAAIKAKTDNLPSDPASAGTITAAFTTLSGHGDTNWHTATGFSTLTQADIRNATGLGSANLDTQLSAILTAATGGGTGLEPETVAALNAASQIILASPYVPTDVPSVVIPAPGDLTQTTAYLTTRDGAGVIQGYVQIQFQLITPPGVDSYSASIFSENSDGNGLLAIPLRQSASYQARRGEEGAWVKFATGTDSQYALPAILGMP